MNSPLLTVFLSNAYRNQSPDQPLRSDSFNWAEREADELLASSSPALFLSLTRLAGTCWFTTHRLTLLVWKAELLFQRL